MEGKPSDEREEDEELHRRSRREQEIEPEVDNKSTDEEEIQEYDYPESDGVTEED